MTTNQITDRALEQWKAEMRALIARESRPIESDDDPRLHALNAATDGRRYRADVDHGSFLAREYMERVMPHPDAPLPAPKWATSQGLGEVSTSWVDVVFYRDDIEWIDATASISQGFPVSLDGNPDPDVVVEREPYLIVNAQEVDFAGPLSVMKDVAGALIVAICIAENRSVVDFALLRGYLDGDGSEGADR